MFAVAFALRKFPGSDRRFRDQTCRDHPFSAPKVRPRTMCFWTKNAITSTGSVMMVDAAVRPPQFRESYETKLKMATGSVRVVLPAITSEKMKLFQDEMMPRIAVATIPGRARGRAIR